MGGLSYSEFTVLQAIVSTTGVLSVLSSVIVISTHYFLSSSQVQTKSNKKLIVYLQLAIFGADLTALAYLGGGECYHYSVLMSFFLLSQAAWGSIVARQLQLLVFTRQSLNRALHRLHSFADGNSYNMRDIERVRMVVFHVLAWGLPLLFSITIYVMSLDTPISMWCWFNQEHTHDGEVTITHTMGPVALFFYLPLAATLVYNVYVLSWSSLKRAAGRVCGDGDDARGAEMHTHHHDTNADPLEKEISRLSTRLRWFVSLSATVSFLLCAAELINVSDTAQSDESRYGLYVFLVLFLRLHGLANLSVYGSRDDVRKCWREVMERCLRHSHSGGDDMRASSALEEAVEGEDSDRSPLAYEPPALEK
jgi:hypothetical protein